MSLHASDLLNTPSTFSRLSNKILMCVEGFCAAYVDDSIIFSDTREENLAHIRVLLTRVRSANLTLSPNKRCSRGRLSWASCRFWTRRAMCSESTGIDLFSGSNPSEATSTVLGVSGLLLKFLPHFARTSACLSDLLKKVTNVCGSPRPKVLVDLAWQCNWFCDPPVLVILLALPWMRPIWLLEPCCFRK